jgi:hypothetical protein
MNDIEKIIISVAGYSFYERMIIKHGQINVLFYGALFIVIGIAVFLGSFSAFLNWDPDGIWDRAKIGDKLYADDLHFENNPNLGKYYAIDQLALPMTVKDIDTMHIPDWQKDKLKYELDTTRQPKLVRNAIVLWVDSMYKYKTSFIGTCVSKDSSSRFDDIIEKWLAIIPNKKFADYSSALDSVPKGYIMQNRYYISSNLTQFQEAKPFLKPSPKH